MGLSGKGTDRGPVGAAQANHRLRWCSARGRRGGGDRRARGRALEPGSAEPVDISDVAPNGTTSCGSGARGRRGVYLFRGSGTDALKAAQHAGRRSSMPGAPPLTVRTSYHTARTTGNGGTSAPYQGGSTRRGAPSSVELRGHRQRDDVEVRLLGSDDQGRSAPRRRMVPDVHRRRTGVDGVTKSIRAFHFVLDPIIGGWLSLRSTTGGQDTGNQNGCGRARVACPDRHAAQPPQISTRLTR
jgi:hypothetical protein